MSEAAIGAVPRDVHTCTSTETWQTILAGSQGLLASLLVAHPTGQSQVLSSVGYLSTRTISLFPGSDPPQPSSFSS